MIDMHCAACGRDLWTLVQILVRPHERHGFCDQACADRYRASHPSTIVLRCASCGADLARAEAALVNVQTGVAYCDITCRARHLSAHTVVITPRPGTLGIGGGSVN